MSTPRGRRTAVIIAAGMGRRLQPFTDTMPKSMVPIGVGVNSDVGDGAEPSKPQGCRPMLTRLIEQLVGIALCDDIVIIRGYCGQYFDTPEVQEMISVAVMHGSRMRSFSSEDGGEEKSKSDVSVAVRFVDNEDFADNNILLSLFKAEHELVNKETGEFFISYSDILLEDTVMEALVRAETAEGEFALIVDQEWEKIYEGRSDHPIEQAELCQVVAKDEVEAERLSTIRSEDASGVVGATQLEASGRACKVVRVGKCCCAPADAVGEFIGLCKVDAAGVAAMVDAYHAARAQHEGQPDKAFVRAKTWTQSYLCDMFEFMVRERGVAMRPVYIQGGWREIDTVQDKKRADETVTW